MTRRAPRSVPVDATVSDLLLDIAFQRVRPPAPNLPDVHGGRWGDVNFADLTCKPSVIESQVVLKFTTSAEEAMRLREATPKARKEAASFSLATGGSLTANVVSHSGTSAKFGKGEGRDGGVELRLLHWSWIPTGKPASLWMGTIEGAIPSSGNLSLVVNGPNGSFSKTSGYRLRGRYDWYLVGDGELPWTVVVDPRGHPVDRETLMVEIICLQFCVGDVEDRSSRWR
jgi:hypothetical protein